MKILILTAALFLLQSGKNFGQAHHSLLYKGNGQLRIDSTLKISPAQLEKWMGIEDLLIKDITDKLEYSQIALSENLSGLSIVSFDIDSTGNVLTFRKLKQVGGGLEEKIKNVIKAFDFLPSLAPSNEEIFTYYLCMDFKLIDVKEFIETQKAIPVYQTNFDIIQK